jgi:isopenicillin N synthase-like dioxygenase
VNVALLSAANLTARDVDSALREHGGFLLHPAIDADLCANAVKAAHDFFALPRSAKQAAAIEHSRHFRGWSEMHNERDWREQIHFGRERAPGGDDPPFRRLDGPNLWPQADAFRATILGYMNAVAEVGERLLTLAATALGVSPSSFDGVSSEGYVLLKLIGYHPQPKADVQRAGVAAHVDFSWLTLTLQDSPGLQIRNPRGDWLQVDPIPGALWVHPGELLQVASGGVYRATPHRVINPSLDRTRVSLPFFLNPPLGGWVEPLTSTDTVEDVSPFNEAEHAHRVIPPGAAPTPFHFGEAEWRRKGMNGWCHQCAPARLE